MDVLLFGFESFEKQLADAGVRVVVTAEFEAAARVIRDSDKVKVFLFDSQRQGGSGYDLAGLMRATHPECLVGQASPAARFLDLSKGAPRKMDFLLDDPFSVADVLALMARYDRGEVGPPAGWDGWFVDVLEIDFSSVDCEEMAWGHEAMVSEMRTWLSPENFERWMALIQPGMEERMRLCEAEKART
ncbi:MAG: hypothetical protein BGO01_13450 [Armatimonadetes bacterium 55-13]|nr:hypothetical protein [Armatimonadota bacterium]OJU61914.1 MAG: hypothetical protein BGO01_13450 [Armatimonadetes bacterium 55-13]